MITSAFLPLEAAMSHTFFLTVPMFPLIRSLSCPQNSSSVPQMLKAVTSLLFLMMEHSTTLSRSHCFIVSLSLCNSPVCHLSVSSSCFLTFIRPKSPPLFTFHFPLHLCTRPHTRTQTQSVSVQLQRSIETMGIYVTQRSPSFEQG